MLDPQADSEDEIECALTNLATEWSMGHMRNGGASGGTASGYHLTVERRDVTHEQYVQALNDYLASTRKERA